MRTRSDVWKLTSDEGDWPQVLIAYGQAVEKMRALDRPHGARPTNPLSWMYQAAIHGRAGADGNPDTSDPQWSNCQHGSWFFLPWHRMYLCAFELVVQQFLGDDGWSLPYWCAIDPRRPESSVLPPAFRDAKPTNQLYTDHRARRANHGRQLSNLVVLAESLRSALDAPDFFSNDGTDSFGGGRSDDPTYFGNVQGLLEDVPHGSVHTKVGNDYDARFGPAPIRRGWMGALETAAQDPIFWLHHANVDRQWQEWLDRDPAHRNPLTESHWAQTSFNFPNPAGGAPLSWTVSEVVNTEALGYRYGPPVPPTANATPPPISVGRRGPLEAFASESPGPPPPPQVVGAATGVSLAGDRVAQIRLSSPSAAALEAFGQPYRRVLLRVEGITGQIAGPVYAIYLNIPEGDPPEQHRERLAGTISTFGIPEASRRNALSDGTGLTKVLDITAVRRALVDAGAWNPASLRVTFVPLVPEMDDDDLEGLDVPEGMSADSDLRAARVAVVLA